MRDVPQAVAAGEGTALLEGDFLDPGHGLNEAAMDGVACALCHQVQDVDLGQEGSYSGQYTVDTDARAPDRPAFGPFPNPFRQVMAMHVGYTPVEGPHIRTAELCATCHTLYTPYVDASGNVLGTVPEQTPTWSGDTACTERKRSLPVLPHAPG